MRIMPAGKIRRIAACHGDDAFLSTDPQVGGIELAGESRRKPVGDFSPQLSEQLPFSCGDHKYEHPFDVGCIQGERPEHGIFARAVRSAHRGAFIREETLDNLDLLAIRFEAQLVAEEIRWASLVAPEVLDASRFAVSRDQFPNFPA